MEALARWWALPTAGSQQQVARAAQFGEGCLADAALADVFYDSAAPSVSGVLFGNKSIGFEGPIEIPDLREEGHGWFGDWNDEIVGLHLERRDD